MSRQDTWFKLTPLAVMIHNTPQAKHHMSHQDTHFPNACHLLWWYTIQPGQISHVPLGCTCFKLVLVAVMTHRSKIKKQQLKCILYLSFSKSGIKYGKTEWEHTQHYNICCVYLFCKTKYDSLLLLLESIWTWTMLLLICVFCTLHACFLDLVELGPFGTQVSMGLTEPCLFPRFTLLCFREKASCTSSLRILGV